MVHKTALWTTLVGSMVLASVASAEAPEHFMNPKENLNPDPNYVPGDYAAPEAFASRTAYAAAKAELANADTAGKGGRLMTLGIGEITFSAAKNQDKSVLGYFRNYFGVAEMAKGGLKKMTMIVDINSLDTAVPGRNNRIIDIFFEAAKPEKGMATIEFTKFKGVNAKVMKKGGTIEAMGEITLNEVKKPISAKLKLAKKGATWMVETAEPIKLLVSEFGYEQAAYALMKSCNHAALGNSTDVKVKLFFR